MKAFLYFLFIASIINPKYTFGQAPATDFSTGLLNLSEKVSKNISDTLGIKKVAVWDFTDVNGATSTLGKYISEKISVNLVNVGKGFQIMNRNHLSQILKEHKLNSDGFIDEKTAKELGKMQAVDAIFTGSVIIFNDKIEVTLQVLETETATIIAAGSATFPMNNDIKSLLGMETTNSNGGTDVNKGYNAPLNSNEVYNNSSTVSTECSKNETGDYCFINKTSYNMEITISWNSGKLSDGTLYKSGYKNIIIKSGETQCFYNLHNGEIEYTIEYDKDNPKATSAGEIHNEYAKGFVMVDKCKSKSYIIK